MKNILSVIFVLSLFGASVYGANNCNPPPPQQLQRSQAFLQNTPCSPLVAACNGGGYVLGCHKGNGKGLEMDCMGPLKKGTAVAGVSMQPNDPSIAACKTFCQQNKPVCRKGER